MQTALWIIQGVLAGIFVVTGLTKLTQPREKMAAGPMSWAADVSDSQFRGIGVLELLGAAGLILPGAAGLILPGVLGIAGILTPLAAAGLALTMVGAILTHARLGETGRLAAPVLLLALALVDASGSIGRNVGEGVGVGWAKLCVDGAPAPSPDRAQRVRAGHACAGRAGGEAAVPGRAAGADRALCRRARARYRDRRSAGHLAGTGGALATKIRRAAS